MKTITIDLPTMYGDHHVVEVRRLLLAIPGVEDVYASSAFQLAEVTFDEEKVPEAELTAVLEKAGYTGELPIPVETGTGTVQENGKRPYFRHTTAFVQADNVVSFQQRVPYAGRPLWPCPGLGPILTPAGKDQEGS